ncbi:MAG TPA: hypothetical protein VKY65_05405, partial [Alphaproteobacteria bacterium]|nr:hypothetical protein [Alphaproteobacteria bacterium]
MTGWNRERITPARAALGESDFLVRGGSVFLLIDIVRRGRDARAAAVAGLWLELFAGASKSIALLSDGSVGCPWFGR